MINYKKHFPLVVFSFIFSLSTSADSYVGSLRDTKNEIDGYREFPSASFFGVANVSNAPSIIEEIHQLSGLFDVEAYDAGDAQNKKYYDLASKMLFDMRKNGVNYRELREAVVDDKESYLIVSMCKDMIARASRRSRQSDVVDDLSIAGLLAEYDPNSSHANFAHVFTFALAAKKSRNEVQINAYKSEYSPMIYSVLNSSKEALGLSEYLAESTSAVDGKKWNELLVENAIVCNKMLGVSGLERKTIKRIDYIPNKADSDALVLSLSHIISSIPERSIAYPARGYFFCSICGAVESTCKKDKGEGRYLTTQLLSVLSRATVKPSWSPLAIRIKKMQSDILEVNNN